MAKRYTVIISKGEAAYVAYCQELGIASQGKSIKEARRNIKEAIELYLEEAKDSKLARTKVPLVTTIKVG